MWKQKYKLMGEHLPDTYEAPGLVPNTVKIKYFLKLKNTILITTV